jgi:hypothetical protein
VRVAGLGGPEPRPEDLLAELARWSATDRAARAASERARTRDLVDQSAATATWSGLLVDLAEAGTDVTVWLEGGRRVTGRLVGTGRDLIVIEDRSGRPVLVRTGAIDALAPNGEGDGPPSSQRSGPPAGRRRPATDLSFAAALDALAAEGSPVKLHSGTEVVTGRLLAAGEDVVTVRSDGAGRRPVHLPLDRVTYVELR